MFFAESFLHLDGLDTANCSFFRFSPQSWTCLWCQDTSRRTCRFFQLPGTATPKKDLDLLKELGKKTKHYSQNNHPKQNQEDTIRETPSSPSTLLRWAVNRKSPPLKALNDASTSTLPTRNTSIAGPLWPSGRPSFSDWIGSKLQLLNSRKLTSLSNSHLPCANSFVIM